VLNNKITCCVTQESAGGKKGHRGEKGEDEGGVPKGRFVLQKEVLEEKELVGNRIKMEKQKEAF